MFNVNDLKQRFSKNARYRRQLDRIVTSNGYILAIEQTTNATLKNVSDKIKSFVIYGEPQSGKTEMMIALTACLLDEGFKIIVVLMNDSVQLLNQNLERFRRSGIDPAPKNFNEILDSAVVIGDREWIIFSKKNPNDLNKLIQKIGSLPNKIIIDDEADYASPNAKVNKGERTKINALIETLIGKDGMYVGVTATPGRLDLNNTFRNENERWVDFLAHPSYNGMDVFFPIRVDNGNIQFSLNLLPEAHDTPTYLRKALFSFFVNVAYLNAKLNSKEINYSILIHTSGKREDHTRDYKEVVKTFTILGDPDHTRFESYYRDIWEIAANKYPGQEGDITRYIAENCNRHTIVVMNSDTDKNAVDYRSATDPSTLFTVAIGGNIVSRGVTFNNLLSMFFTRDVKHKIQQDTYIQRARMFGTRGTYLPFFELHIPSNLYLDWHKCFVFHRLSLASIRAGNGSPVWLEDGRVSAVAGSSIDKATISVDSGEMSFDMFDYDEDCLNRIIVSEMGGLQKLEALAAVIGETSLPPYLLEYVRNFSPKGDLSVAVHPSRPAMPSADQEKIERKKAFIGNTDLELKKYPEAIHHFKIYYNAKKRARLFYRYQGSIKFLRNLRDKANAQGL